MLGSMVLAAAGHSRVRGRVHTRVSKRGTNLFVFIALAVQVLLAELGACQSA